MVLKCPWRSREGLKGENNSNNKIIKIIIIKVLVFYFSIEAERSLPGLLVFIYNSSVSVYVTELLLNGWTDFDEIFCVCSRGSENGLDSQFCPLDNVFSINF